MSEFSRRDFLKIISAAAGAAILNACAPELNPKPSQTEASPTPTAMPTKEGGFAVPTQENQSSKVVVLQGVDKSTPQGEYSLSKTRDLFGNSYLSFSNEDGTLNEAVPAKDSKYSVYDQIDVMSGNTKLNSLYLLTGPGGSEVLSTTVQTVEGTVFVGLDLVDTEEFAAATLPGKDSNGNAVAVPILLRSRVNPEKGWFLNTPDAKYYPVQFPPESGSGGVLAMLNVDRTSLAIAGQTMGTDTNWRLTTTDGREQIVDLNGKVLYNKFDEETGEWIKESAIPTNIDLEPNYTQEISVIYEDVKFRGQIITDKALLIKDAPVRKVTIPDETAAKFIAECYYTAWGADKGSLKDYMALWAKAQSTGLEEDWKKVQFDIYSDNMDKMVTVWPMCNGTTPDGVVAINNFSVAYVDGKRNKNVTILYGYFEEGVGTNIFAKDGLNTLYFYVAPTYGTAITHATTAIIAENTSEILWYIKNNKGQKFSGNLPTSSVYNARVAKNLRRGGLTKE